MWISSVEIKNFRNYQKEGLDFSPGLNYIFGRNGAGKTNLLEAVGLLSHGKSMRLRNLEDLIRDGDDNAFLRGIYQDEKKSNLLVNCALTRFSGKRISVNGKTVGRISDVFRLAPTVQCFENDTLLIQGSPSVRRNFLNCLCAQLYPSYLAYHKSFREILAQRNSALKNKTLNGSMKTAIDEVFVNRSVPVIQLRQKALYGLAQLLKRQASGLMEEEDFCISRLGSDFPQEASVIGENLYRRLDKLSIEESRFFRTSSGPHRDSFDFSIGNGRIKCRSSRGQVKNMIFRLKMAEFDLLKSELGKVPIVLLDDVFAEMDQIRRGNLSKLLKLGAQVFLASTDDSFTMTCNVNFPMRKINIGDGVVISNQVVLSAA